VEFSRSRRFAGLCDGYSRNFLIRMAQIKSGGWFLIEKKEIQGRI